MLDQLAQLVLALPALGLVVLLSTLLEIIRLSKKFDIFMKRFMRAEEDIKEVK